MGRADRDLLQGFLDFFCLQGCGVDRCELVSQRRVGVCWVALGDMSHSPRHGLPCGALSILGHRCQQRPPEAEFISFVSVLERSWRGRLLHEVGATGAFAGSQRVWRQLCLEVGLEPMASLHLPSWSLQDFRSHFLRGRLRVPGPSSRVCHCWHASLSCSTPACGTMQCFMLGCRWGRASRAPGLCVTSSRALAQPGDILGFSIP